jgi:hypothetical protein
MGCTTNLFQKSPMQDLPPKQKVRNYKICCFIICCLKAGISISDIHSLTVREDCSITILRRSHCPRKFRTNWSSYWPRSWSSENYSNTMPKDKKQSHSSGWSWSWKNSYCGGAGKSYFSSRCCSLSVGVFNNKWLMFLKFFFSVVPFCNCTCLN